MELFLIDGIGPFFVDYNRKRINWSKIPFDNLESHGHFDHQRFRRIKEQFKIFIERVQPLGFNAVTLDDLAHLVTAEFYPNTLKGKIENYQEAYHELIEIIHDAGMRTYITSDVMFFHESMRGHVRRRIDEVCEFLSQSVNQLLANFSGVQGVILRIGECDSQDVRSDFRSELAVRTASDAREVLKHLLPVFEAYERDLIVRTWSVGTYAIGDLAWNRNTYSKVFEPFESERLIISMKHGESDFFRYLPLNKLFYRSSHKKIIELQARREYEGFGEYPSFIGWDYDSFAIQLDTAENVIGCSVWCQTGGWSKFRRLTFLDNSSFWNELNTEVSIRIVKERASPEQAIESFYKRRFHDDNWRLLLELLRLSDEVIRELLYINDFSKKKIFFRRVRVPPVLWVFWDQIIISHFMRKLLRLYVEDPEYTVTEGKLALDKIERMRELADEIGIENSGLEFQCDTFSILCAAREYYLLPFSEEVASRLKQLKTHYEEKYPEGYEIMLDLRSVPFSSRSISRFLSFALREKRGYRMLDQLVIIRALRYLYPIISLFERFWLPEFSKDRAMGIRSIFR